MFVKHKATALAFILICAGLLLMHARAWCRQTEQNAGVPAIVKKRIDRIENGLRVQSGAETKPFSLAERMAFYKVPGVSVAVINNGAIEWERGYGVLEAGAAKPITSETLFQAASISKPVAAMGLLYLVQQGRVSLDEDMNRKLHSWQIPENAFTTQQKVTLRRLLSHQAGLTVHGFGGYAAGTPVPSLLAVLQGGPGVNSAPVRVDMEPGKQYRYSGGGYCVAQQLAMDLSGKPFPEFMQETVLSKIGMTHSAYQQPLSPEWRSMAASGHAEDGSVLPGKWHIYPELAAAGLWTTPADLARFAIEVLKSYAGRSNKVLSQRVTTWMLTPDKGGYGLGLSVNNRSFSHGGANEGFRCRLVCTPSGKGAVVMTNSDAGDNLINEIIANLEEEYGWYR